MNFKQYYATTLCVVLAVSIYPLYMGICVAADAIRYGIVASENYPKYIIPYTPIALAVIVAVVLMPIIIKFAKKISFLVSSIISLSVFFIAEYVFESKVVINGGERAVKLEDWQMYMCYVPPAAYEERTWTPY